jgi:hypothetical protein
MYQKRVKQIDEGFSYVQYATTVLCDLDLINTL